MKKNVSQLGHTGAGQVAQGHPRKMGNPPCLQETDDDFDSPLGRDNFGLTRGQVKKTISISI